MKVYNKTFLYVAGGIFVIGASWLFFGFSPWLEINNRRVVFTVTSVITAAVTFLGVFLAAWLDRRQQRKQIRIDDRRSLKAALTFLFKEIMDNYEVLTDLYRQITSQVPPSKQGVAGFLADFVKELRHDVYLGLVASRSIVFLNSDDLVNAIQHIYKSTATVSVKWKMIAQLSNDPALDKMTETEKKSQFDPIFDHGVERLQACIEDYRHKVPIIVDSMKGLGLTYKLQTGTEEIDFMNTVSLAEFLRR